MENYIKIITAIVGVFIIPKLVRTINQHFFDEAKKESGETTDKLIMRAPKAISFIAIPCEIFFIVVSVLSFVQDGFSQVIVFNTIVLNALGLTLCLAPVPMFWDKIYENGQLTIIKFFLFKKTINIDEIDYVRVVGPDYLIYKKGRKSVFCIIDGMDINSGTFFKMLEKYGVQYCDKNSQLRITINHQDEPEFVERCLNYVVRNNKNKVFWKRNIVFVLWIVIGVVSLIYMLPYMNQTVTPLSGILLFVTFFTPIFLFYEIRYIKFYTRANKLYSKYHDDNIKLILRMSCFVEMYVCLGPEVVDAIYIKTDDKKDTIKIITNEKEKYTFAISHDVKRIKQFCRDYGINCYLDGHKLVG